MVDPQGVGDDVPSLGRRETGQSRSGRPHPEPSPAPQDPQTGDGPRASRGRGTCTVTVYLNLRCRSRQGVSGGIQFEARNPRGRGPHRERGQKGGSRSPGRAALQGARPAPDTAVGRGPPERPRHCPRRAGWRRCYRALSRVSTLLPGRNPEPEVKSRVPKVFWSRTFLGGREEGGRPPRCPRDTPACNQRVSESRGFSQPGPERHRVPNFMSPKIPVQTKRHLSALNVFKS